LVGRASPKRACGPDGSPKKTCSGPFHDDKVLACAQAAEADYLVSGDSDLLERKKFRGVTILTPRDFELLFAH
jgi:predicted nucleic acid-binding protein